MQIRQIAGAALYAARFLQNADRLLARTLKRVREIGYQAVQISGIAPIPERN